MNLIYFMIPTKHISEENAHVKPAMLTFTVLILLLISCATFSNPASQGRSPTHLLEAMRSEPLSSPPPSLTIAVAANFKNTLEKLITSFNTSQPNRIEFEIISGASGHLFHQIRHGAPYDMFFSANALYIHKLEELELGHNEMSAFTYALGTLALWHPNHRTIDIQTVTAISESRRFATAHPTLAPYGRAARTYLSNLNRNFDYKLITANNISQTFAWIQTGNADMGLVAYSHLLQENIPTEEYSLIDQKLYPIIEQTALALERAERYPAANHFYHFLHTPKALRIIQADGYTLPPQVDAYGD